jgi:hypothetical protein
MRYVLSALVVLAILAYVAINVVRYPWHTLVFVLAAIALSIAAGAGSRVMAWLAASPHPAARRLVAGCTGLNAIVQGAPPYNEGRWWVVRSLVQFVYWAIMLVLGIAVLAALGGVFVWLDRILK